MHFFCNTICSGVFTPMKIVWITLQFENLQKRSQKEKISFNRTNYILSYMYNKKNVQGKVERGGGGRKTIKLLGGALTSMIFVYLVYWKNLSESFQIYCVNRTRVYTCNCLTLGVEVKCKTKQKRNETSIPLNGMIGM